MQINRQRSHREFGMPTLSNPRHEKFAQELVAGKSAAEAYELAGYTPNYGNCIRLKGNERVVARVVELQCRGAEQAEVTVSSLLAELEEARQLAFERGQPSAAVAASMGKAKLTGQIVERAEVGQPGQFDHMTDEQLVEETTKLARRLGIPTLRLVDARDDGGCNDP
jgi:phage terminase small subunit